MKGRGSGLAPVDAPIAGRRATALLGACLVILLAGLVLGSGSSISAGPGARSSLVSAAGRCPAGSAEADAPASQDGAGRCTAMGGPESYSDVAANVDQMVARGAAPFSRVASGAYASALAQKSSVLGPGAYPGSAGSWSPAGSAPLCDGHTTQSNLCPLADTTDNAVLNQPANGDYTIALLGHKTLSGRISSFAYDAGVPGDPTHPANRAHLWASPTVGGVFETVDGGSTWHSVGDRLPTQAVGAIAYSPAQNLLVAASGDNSFGGSGIAGHGIFWSTDDGGIWNTSAGIPDLALGFRVVVSPADPSGRTIYAATSLGLFRSTDGAHSFVNLRLPTGAIGSQAYTVPASGASHAPQVSCTGDTSTPLCFFANIVTDVVVKGSESTNAPEGAVMAVIGWRAGQRVNKDAAGNPVTTCVLGGVANSPCVQAPRNGIFVSPFKGDATGACVANGTTLTKDPSHNPGDPGSFCYEDEGGSAQQGSTARGFAGNVFVGRTGLGIAHGQGQNNDAVYALVQDAKKFQGCPDVLDTASPVCSSIVNGEALATYLDGMYASYDFGNSWTKIMDYTQTKYPGNNSALLGQVGYSPGIQSWYNNWVEPDPTATDSTSHNPTRVLFGLEEIWENNMALGNSVLTTAAPGNGVPGVQDPWVVIGRYWDACLGQVAGMACNSLSAPSSGSTTHPDQHAALFVPDPSGGGVTFFAGNDGGAYKQHVASGADFSNESWGDGINTGLYSLQPYDADIAKDGTIVAGLQDNGEEKIAPGGKENHTIFGGDGFWTTIDPNNSQNIIEEYTYASQVNLSLNGGKDWYGIAPGACNSSEALFSTVIEQDPTIPGHDVVGCTQIQEGGGDATTSVYNNPCSVPPGANPFTCQLLTLPWATVFDLGTADAPGQPADRNVNCNVNSCVFNVPSAVGVRGASVYVGYCGYCDVVTGGLPFISGIATNVGGSKPANIGTGDGWHTVGPGGNGHPSCTGCGTESAPAPFTGTLPQRYITSIQPDPSDPRTVYVTLGGYGRRWIPPGALGDDVSKVGVGHVFASHDAGQSFTNISGNLPDVPANYTLVHNGQLVVATDLGVFIAGGTTGGNYAQLGTGLPNVPVFTLRTQPGNPDLMVAATYGRGVYKYGFSGAVPVAITAGTNAANQALPGTSAGRPLPPAIPGGLAVLALAATGWWQRRRRLPAG